jgi:ribosome maturation protein SDO1
MAGRLSIPVGIKKLTNVAVVRYKTHGIRFEIACYKNTVISYRAGAEKDLDNVLQTTAIYLNVSKGIVAKEADMKKAFGTTDEEKICRVILEKGELQVGEKEREVGQESMTRDCVNILVEKTINPETNRPYPHGMIESALKECHFSVDPTKSAKQQALAMIPKLAKLFPIKRAPMRFKFTVVAESEEEAKTKEEDMLNFLKEHEANVETNSLSKEKSDSNDSNSKFTRTIVCTIESSMYRPCDAYAKASKGSVRLDVLSLSVTAEAESRSAFDESSLQNQTATYRKQKDMEDSLEGGMARLQLGQRSDPTRIKASSRSNKRDEKGTGAGVEMVVDEKFILVPRGFIKDLPEEHKSRRERFQELDTIEEGWHVELRKKESSSIVEAVFFSPNNEAFKSYAEARRKALGIS